MPDIFTPRPDIVKKVLEDAGLEARVTPTILTNRPADITYRFRGTDYYAELYVHDLAALPARSVFPEPTSLGVGILLGMVATVAIFWRRLRAQRR
ncbi:MAG: hypothetical protein N3A53_08060 [Verrucomicrobiae bacterium]|nr:hypothetical protein [Verrucomicrobiae bacterium]